MKTISMATSDLWKEVLAVVNKAVVFMDNACTEILHWHGGLCFLTEAGACDVKEFSSFESAVAGYKKAVFITSGCLEGVTREIIRDIIQASKFQYVIIITTVTPRMHLFNKTGSYDGDIHYLFEQLEDDVLEWLGNKNYTVEIKHIPLVNMCLNNNFFLMPAFNELFPLIETDLKQLRIQQGGKQGEKKMKFEHLNDLDITSLPTSLKQWYTMFVSSIDSLLSELEVNEDCYSIGPTSKILASELANFPPAKTRKKSAPHKASILFVDRTLDIASSCTHQTETLLDRIINVLPRLPGHNNDVSIDMSSLRKENSYGTSNVFPGCLASFNGQTQQHLLPLMNNKLKEGLMEVNRQLVEIASKEKIPVKLTGKPGRVTAEQLYNTLMLFHGQYFKIVAHFNELQASMATCQTLMSNRHQKLEELSGFEKLLVQGYSDENDPLEDVQKLINTELQKSPNDRSHTLDDIFCLITFVYSVYGDKIKMDAEEKLKTLLVNFILQEKNHFLCPLTQQIVGDTVNKEIVCTIIDDVWEKFHALSTVRNDMKQFKSVCEESSLGPTQMKPLLKQLISEIFDPNKPDLPDIELKSSGLGGLLKSGLGLFRTVSKPRPSDHPLLILFVVGGVTATEIKQIKDLLTTLKPSTQVIIGSTQLVKPQDIVSSLLCKDRINRN